MLVYPLNISRSRHLSIQRNGQATTHTSSKPSAEVESRPPRLTTSNLFKILHLFLQSTVSCQKKSHFPTKFCRTAASGLSIFCWRSAFKKRPRFHLRPQVIRSLMDDDLTGTYYGPWLSLSFFHLLMVAYE